MDASKSMMMEDGIDMELDTLKITGDASKLYEALAKASMDFLPVPKTSQGQVGQQKFKYAGYAKLMRCVRPALSANGIAVLQPLHWRDGRAISTTILAGHGATIQSSFAFDGDFRKKQKDNTVVTDPQEFGRHHTYYRRYQLQAMLGLEGDADADDLPDVNEEKAQFSEPARDATTGEAAPSDGKKAASSPKAEVSVEPKPAAVSAPVSASSAPVKEQMPPSTNGSSANKASESNKSLNELLTMAMKELKWGMGDLREFFKEHVDPAGVDKVNNLTVAQKQKLMDQLVKLKGVVPF